MGIISYTPPKKVITDLRSVDGDYYTALCDVCGTEFFPKRRSAKYCNPNCKVIQFRINLANGNVAKKTQKTDKIPKKSKFIDTEIRGIINVYNLLKDLHNTHGHKQEIFEACRSLEVDGGIDFFEFGNTHQKHKISRLSEQNFFIELSKPLY